MRRFKNMALTMLGLLAVSAASAQSLADAQKAINAEQYQKAKSMLKNLTVTQATKDENFFYLGWVYVIQEYADSARTAFNQGIAVNPKSALNYAGLGVAARLDKDQANAKLNFDKALALAGKDSRPYTYIGKGYLLPPVNFEEAVSVLQKGKTVNEKDAELFITLGNAYLTKLKSNDAFANYNEALALNPKSAAANVAIGVLVRYANNYPDSEVNFQKAIAIDPDYGPAYREWAETDLRWAQNEPKMASAKVKEALEHYQKFLSLTDMSVESRLRYMAFLINAGDFKTLQTEAAALAQTKNPNLRVQRYLAMAALENKDYAAGLVAIQKFINEAGEKRIIPRDYLTLGRLQIASGNDSLGVQALTKAYALDSTQADVFLEIAKSNYARKKYAAAADAYRKYTSSSRQAKLSDFYAEGLSYYLAYKEQAAAPKSGQDTTYLTKADSALTHVQQKAASPNAQVAFYLARINDYKEPDRNNIKGLAKPYYEQYIQLLTAKGPTPADKNFLVEAYVYLGRYYEYIAKDSAKADENFGKAKELDATDANVVAYYQRKGKAK